jgi:hypothetical protein
MRFLLPLESSAVFLELRKHAVNHAVLEMVPFGKLLHKKNLEQLNARVQMILHYTVPLEPIGIHP